jgi:hypothetical protein
MPQYTTSTPGERSALVQPGEYRIRCVDAIEKLSTNKNIMVVMTFDILDAEGDKIGKVIDRLVFTDAAKWKIDEYLNAMGKHPGENVNFDFQCRDQLGEECQAQIDIGTSDKGTQYNTVKAYLTQEY